MTEAFTITLPLPSKILSPNCRPGSIGSRFMEAAATKKYRKLAKEAVEAEQINSAPWLQARVDASFYFKIKRRRDDDNAMGSIKAAYDGIVDAGIVTDDDPKHMERTRPALYVDRLCPRVVLTITRCH